MVDSSSTAPSRGRRWLKVLAWVAGVPLVLFIAWVVSNRLFDATARPLPAALAPPPAPPVEGNAFYALQGVMAPAGVDPAKAGADDWAANMRWGAAVAAGQAASAPQGLPGSFTPPAKSPWQCGDDAGCYDKWLKDAAALAEQRQSIAEVGRRCEAIVQGLGRYEEPWPPRMHAAMPLPMLQNLVVCATWFRSGAALAFVAGERELLLAQLAAGDQLLRAVMAGGHSLLTQMVSVRMAREHLRLMGTLLMRDATLAAPFAPLLAPYAGEGARLRRWMAYEAGFQRSVADLPGEACDVGWWADWFCVQRVGLQPERTRQRVDDIWMARIALTERQEPALALLDAARAQVEPSLTSALRWFNPVGHVLVDVASPSYASYHARIADQNLHRIALLMAAAVQQEGVAPAGRAAWSKTWLENQKVSEPYRARFTWSADGRVLEARTWESEVGSTLAKQARDQIRLAWPE